MIPNIFFNKISFEDIFYFGESDSDIPVTFHFFQNENKSNKFYGVT